MLLLLITCYAGGNVNSTSTSPTKGGDLLETSLQILPNSPHPGKAGQSPQILPAPGASLPEIISFRQLLGI